MDGVIKHKQEPNGFGTYAVIDHGGGVESYYGHLAGYRTGDGQQVKQGQVIGLSGNTGRVRGDGGGYHLHYEVRVNGKSVDPKTLGEKDIDTGSADGGSVRPAAPGKRRLDLAASLQQVEDDDTLPRARKEARKRVLRERSGLEAETERGEQRDVREGVARYLNTLNDPDDFTNYDSLPADLRMELSDQPELQLHYKERARANDQTRLARVEAQNQAARGDLAAQADWDMLKLAYGDAATFDGVDFISGMPHLSNTDRAKWFKFQQEKREAKANPGKSLDYDGIRVAVQRHVRPGNAVSGKKDGDPERVDALYQKALQLGKGMMQQNKGEPLTRAQIEGIAATVMMPTQVGKKAIPRGEQEGRGGVNPYEYVRARLMARGVDAPTDAQIARGVLLLRQGKRF